MRIKICGITRTDDARAASRAGADLIGLNFYPPSPRYVGQASVEALLDAVEPPAVAVAVTVNPAGAELDALIAPGPRVGPRGFAVVQLSGDEPPSLADYLIERSVRVIKAFRPGQADFVKPIRDWLAELARPAGMLAVLLDAPAAGPARYGGSGRTFDWKWIAEARQAGRLEGLPPILLAGGLTPANVAQAVRIARPWGVDTASGVEVEGSPGVKSLDKIRAFIRNARAT